MERERDKRSFLKGSFLKNGSKINAKLQNLQKRHHSSSTTADMSHFQESATIDTDGTYLDGKFVFISNFYTFSVVKIILFYY
jgi:hypothetical protein